MLTCFTCGHSWSKHVEQTYCINYNLYYGNWCPCPKFIPCVELGQVWECLDKVWMRRRDDDVKAHLFSPGDRIIIIGTYFISGRLGWTINFFGILYQTRVNIIHDYFQLI